MCTDKFTSYEQQRGLKETLPIKLSKKKNKRCCERMKKNSASKRWRPLYHFKMRSHSVLQTPFCSFQLCFRKILKLLPKWKYWTGSSLKLDTDLNMLCWTSMSSDKCRFQVSKRQNIYQRSSKTKRAFQLAARNELCHRMLLENVKAVYTWETKTASCKAALCSWHCGTYYKGGAETLT